MQQNMTQLQFSLKQSAIIMFYFCCCTDTENVKRPERMNKLDEGNIQRSPRNSLGFSLDIQTAPAGSSSFDGVKNKCCYKSTQLFSWAAFPVDIRIVPRNLIRICGSLMRPEPVCVLKAHPYGNVTRTRWPGKSEKTRSSLENPVFWQYANMTVLATTLPTTTFGAEFNLDKSVLSILNKTVRQTGHCNEHAGLPVKMATSQKVTFPAENNFWNHKYSSHLCCSSLDRQGTFWNFCKVCPSSLLQ